MADRLTCTDLARELYQRFVQPNTYESRQDITPWDRLPSFLQNDWRRTALHVADLLGYELTEEPAQEATRDPVPVRPRDEDRDPD